MISLSFTPSASSPWRKPRIATAGTAHITASNARWYLTWKSRSATDGFEPGAGCPPRGSICARAGRWNNPQRNETVRMVPNLAIAARLIDTPFWFVSIMATMNNTKSSIHMGPETLVKVVESLDHLRRIMGAPWLRIALNGGIAVYP